MPILFLGSERQMGWLRMSKQDLRRVEVLPEVLAGSRTTESAAAALSVSLRQAQRLVATYRDGTRSRYLRHCFKSEGSIHMGAGPFAPSRSALDCRGATIDR